MDFREYIKTLDEKKPVVMCGDLNVAHLDIGNFLILACIFAYYCCATSVVRVHKFVF